MTNKLLLGFITLTSINLVSADPHTITYPINTVAGGTLNLQTETEGYVFAAACSAISDDATLQAIIDANKYVKYNENFSATGNVSLTFTDVTFEKNLTLDKITISNTDYNPAMSVLSRMSFTDTSTINTGTSTIKFGEDASLDITNGTFTKLSASGKSADSKLVLLFSDDDGIRADYTAARTTLLNKLTNCQFTNASIQDIWVTGGKGADTSSGMSIKAEQSGEHYNISIVNVTGITDSQVGSTFINDDATLKNTLASKGISIIAADDINDLDTAGDEIVYSVDFGADMNNSITAENGTQIVPNTAGNVFIDWLDDEYDLMSDTNSTSTDYKIFMNIKPSEEKMLFLKSSNTGLNTIVFNGEQNSNLTVALISESMTEVDYSPTVASYCKIDAAATKSDLVLKVLGYNKTGEEIAAKDFVMNSAPTVYFENEYSLEIGKNVNVKLTDDTYTFKSITVSNTEEGDFDSSITIGCGATLNL